MVFWMAAAAAVSIGGKMLDAKSANSQNKNQKAWNEYNSQVQYHNDLSNIAAERSIAELNASRIVNTSELTASTNEALVSYNKSVVESATAYNDLLYEQDLAQMWDQAGLDMSTIATQRARERGNMEANQSASGTTMGEGSNADAVIDQRTQEALDLFVVKTGAYNKAADITNARAKSKWEGEQAVKRLEFEGWTQNISTKLNASLEASGILAESDLRTIANTSSAKQGLSTGLSNAKMVADQNKAKINSNLVSGIIGVAADTMSNIAKTAPVSGATTASTKSSVSPGFGDRTSILGGSGGV